MKLKILSERRFSKEEEKKEEAIRRETEIVPVREETQEGRGTKMLEKIALITALPKVDINEEEIAANEFKDLIISGTKIAKHKKL
jgi:hypothetical protein